MSTIEGCRICNSRSLRPVLSFGNMPLVNALLTEDELDQGEKTYPLDLVFCTDCFLLQITETVDPGILFSNYLYFSSFSDTMVDHSRQLAESIIDTRLLGPGSLVVEIASNDGYLLKHYRERGVPVLGVEPAVNVAEVAVRNGVPTVCDFFSDRLAASLAEQGKADVIHAHNVLAHVADLHGVVRGIRRLLKDDGIAVIEVPYAREMIDKCEFDTIYHEHLCYFSLHPLVQLFQLHRMVITGVEVVDIHGGSLRLTASPAGERPVTGTQVESVLEEELVWGVSSGIPYSRFAATARSRQDEIIEAVTSLKKEGFRLAGYGAAAKGCVLLNSCRIGREHLDFVVDRSKYKQGRYMPGNHLPILPPSALLEEMPRYVLLLSWNFAPEILEQQAEYRKKGGHFIIPVPELSVV